MDLLKRLPHTRPRAFHLNYIARSHHTHYHSSFKELGNGLFFTFPDRKSILMLFLLIHKQGLLVHGYC